MKSSSHVGLYTFFFLQKRVIQERITESRNRVGKDVDLFDKSETRILVGVDCSLKSSVFISKGKGEKENRSFSVQLMQFM